MEPPVPIPNTVVKRFSADDTEGATLCGKYVTARKLSPVFSCVDGGGHEREAVRGRKIWLAGLRSFQSELAECLP